MEIKLKTPWIRWPEITPKTETFVMDFGPKDTVHICFRFRTMEMSLKTHRISGAETPADISGFSTHIRVAEIQLETSPEMLRGSHI